jgi:hypothetical protein
MTTLEVKVKGSKISEGKVRRGDEVDAEYLRGGINAARRGRIRGRSD